MEEDLVVYQESRVFLVDPVPRDKLVLRDCRVMLVLKDPLVQSVRQERMAVQEVLAPRALLALKVLLGLRAHKGPWKVTGNSAFGKI